MGDLDVYGMYKDMKKIEQNINLVVIRSSKSKKIQWRKHGFIIVILLNFSYLLKLECRIYSHF